MFLGSESGTKAIGKDSSKQTTLIGIVTTKEKRSQTGSQMTEVATQDTENLIETQPTDDMGTQS